MISNHSTRDFFINLFFFYLLPIILLVKLITFARGQGLFKQPAPHSSSGGLEQDVESAVYEPVPAAKQTPNARRIIPKNVRNMKAVPKLKANAAKLKGK